MDFFLYENQANGPPKKAVIYGVSMKSQPKRLGRSTELEKFHKPLQTPNNRTEPTVAKTRIYIEKNNVKTKSIKRRHKTQYCLLVILGIAGSSN